MLLAIINGLKTCSCCSGSVQATWFHTSGRAATQSSTAHGAMTVLRERTCFITPPPLSISWSRLSVAMGTFCWVLGPLLMGESYQPLNRDCWRWESGLRQVHCVHSISMPEGSCHATLTPHREHGRFFVIRYSWSMLDIKNSLWILFRWMVQQFTTQFHGRFSMTLMRSLSGTPNLRYSYQCATIILCLTRNTGNPQFMDKCLLVC